MILQLPQARVRLGLRTLPASSGLAQLAAEIAQLKDALIAVAYGLLAQRCAAGGHSLPMPPMTKHSGVANSRLRIVKDRA